MALGRVTGESTDIDYGPSIGQLNCQLQKFTFNASGKHTWRGCSCQGIAFNLFKKSRHGRRMVCCIFGRIQ